MESIPIVVTEQGNCGKLGIDVQLMHPEPGDKEAEAIAKSVCINCTAESVCLGYALRNKERHGVWGGQTESERRTSARKIVRNRNGNGRS